MDWAAAAVVLVVGAFAVSVLVAFGVVVWADVRLTKAQAANEKAMRAVLLGREARTKEQVEAQVEHLTQEAEGLRARDAVEVANELLEEERRKEKPS